MFRMTFVDSRYVSINIKVAYQLHSITLNTVANSNRTSSSGAPLTSQRWVPPKLRDQFSPDEVTFRRIRGWVDNGLTNAYSSFFFDSILNKLTPDNFDKLSKELSHYISGNDKDVLKGAILLVSQKLHTEKSIFLSTDIWKSNWWS